jgi:hypothetical protein
MNKIYKQLITLVMVMIISFNSKTINFENQNKASYLFVPGLTSYETQLARYLPEFTGITGEKVSCTNGIHSVGENVSTCKFSEIKLKSTKHYFKNPLDLITSVFIGLRDRKFYTQVKKDTLELGYTLNSPAINFFNINLGQANDIEMLKNTYEEHIKKFPNQKIILYGTSRGAAAAFNFIAQYKPDEAIAAVFEGIYDNIDHLLEGTCGYFKGIAHSFIRVFTAYKLDGISPIKSINNFPKNIPVLIISSKKDGTVPFSCAKNMYKQLKIAGHDNVHFLKLKHSNHDTYSCQNNEDRKIYEEVIHAFYKHYELPYNPELAEKGAAKWSIILDKSKQSMDFAS